MNTNEMPDLLAQFVRYAMIAFGGWLASKGMDGDTANLVVGFVSAGIALAWGFYVKKGTKAVSLTTLDKTRANIPTVSGLTGKTQ